MLKINGDRLRQWRDDANYTQEGLAELLGCSVRSLRNAETQGEISEQIGDAVCSTLNKSLDDLKRLTPDLRVAFLDGFTVEQDDLFESATQCHRTLFTDYFSEVARQNGRQWIAESSLWKESGTPWREIYAVAYEDGRDARKVVGIMTMSGHKDWEFYYCTRLGVLPQWRAGLTVERMLFDAIRTRCAAMLPKATTYLWEIHADEVKLLHKLRAHVASGGTIASWPDKKDATRALRAARRMELFGFLHGLIAATPKKEVLTITSPAWREPLTAENERETMILIQPEKGDLARRNPTVLRAVEFIYRALNADSFSAGVTPIDFKGYSQYIEKLFAKTKPSAASADWMFLPQFADLVSQAKAEGLWRDIALLEAEK